MSRFDLRKLRYFYGILVVSFLAADAFGWCNYQGVTDRGHVITRADERVGCAGDYAQLAIPISALIYSAAIGDYEGDLQLTKAASAAMATTYILKYTIREDRPDSPPDSKGETFPSGHTSFAFSGAAYWQQRYGWYVGAPMYAAAAFVAYSRVRTKRHSWFDVSTGAAIGIGFNYLFTTKYGSDHSVFVVPTDGGAYISFGMKF
ncbi:PAP2 family phosphoesterase [Campylobacterota bacterium]|nr:PAP2 family phosphoesterase [Campylobacterota bacterium]